MNTTQYLQRRLPFVVVIAASAVLWALIILAVMAVL